MAKNMHSEFCYIPKCITEKGTWFAVPCLNWSMRGARESFLDDDTDWQNEWKIAKRAGWRIVKVKVSEIKP